MAVARVGNYYNDALYSWQSQQLKATGSGSSSSASSSVSSLLSGTNMGRQISSLVELTKYAMDAMGVSKDSRVTFSQITKYRQQLQNDFNSRVKDGLATSGIGDISALSYSLDKDGAISVSGGTAADRKLAQAWFDANPGYGRELRQSLSSAGVGENSVNFRIASTGKITVLNPIQANIQSALDEKASLAEDLRAAMRELGIENNRAIQFSLDDSGNLIAAGEGMEELNKWLAENTDLSTAVKKQLEAYKVDATAVGLRLGTSGNIQISVNNAEINEAQSALDKASQTGQKIYGALNNLGIDADINFSIQVNDDGSVKIISDHQDRDKVQQFFDNDPDLVKLYRQIETLAGLDDARKAMQISPAEMRKRIQIESMAAWWAGSDDSSSYFGSYSGNNGLSLLSGLNLTV